jgi:hypothetical protein
MALGETGLGVGIGFIWFRTVAGSGFF